MTERPREQALGEMNGQEKRRTPRRAGGNVFVRMADADGNVKPYQGWIIDRSEQGMCLAVPEAMSVETILRIQPVHLGASVPWVKVRVCRCRASGAGWEIGCEFLYTPTPSVMLLLG